MTWSHGYFTDLTYSHGYYREMSPLMLRLACMSAEIHPEIPENPTYLELGFGQGVSINIHAAASQGEYWGTDFNPGQAVAARRMGAACGTDILLFDSSFEELAARGDLPDFDIIALHGIWSWISESNRNVIVDIVRRKLRPGGVAYISYNCLPGWAPVIPIRDLLMLHSEYGLGQAQDPRGAIEGAISFTKEIIGAGRILSNENPYAAHQAKRLETSGRNYVAHEYMNADWHLVNFSGMMKSLEEAKLSFVGSSRFLDRFDGLNLTDDGRKLIGNIGNPILKETIRDYLRNARFRCDVFIKGPSRIQGRESRDAWYRQKFVLLKCRDEVPEKIPFAMGEVDLPQKLYAPLADALAEGDYIPKSLDDILRRPGLNGFKPPEVIEGLLVLVGANVASPAQGVTATVGDRCRALNQYVRERALVSTDINFMASPVTGGGILVPHVNQMFMNAEAEGKTTAEQLALFLWDFLDGIGERLNKDGKRLEAKEDNVAELTKAADRYLAHERSLLCALGVM